MPPIVDEKVNVHKALAEGSPLDVFQQKPRRQASLISLLFLHAVLDSPSPVAIGNNTDMLGQSLEFLVSLHSASHRIDADALFVVPCV